MKIVLFAVRLAGEKARCAAPENMDTHFIDRVLAAADIHRRRLFCGGLPMRPNGQQMTGEMRRRITRRCVSAATGACR
ncbi:MAG: hypothetical protein ACRC1G_14795 [Bradyrhizobium sp.]|nr:hypothetical protein [Bradyrhizobium sp.]